jgi:hypothetical protein
MEFLLAILISIGLFTGKSDNPRKGDPYNSPGIQKIVGLDETEGRV